VQTVLIDPVVFRARVKTLPCGGFASEVAAVGVFAPVETLTNVSTDLGVGAVGVDAALGLVDVVVAAVVGVAVVHIDVETTADGSLTVVVDAVVVGEALGEGGAGGLGGGLAVGTTGDEEKQCCPQESSGEKTHFENLHGFLLGWLLWWRARFF